MEGCDKVEVGRSLGSDLKKLLLDSAMVSLFEMERLLFSCICDFKGA